MSIQVACTCGKRFKVKDEWAGKRCKCPACQQPVTIPAAPASLESPAPSHGGGIGDDDLLSAALDDAQRPADASESRSHGPGRGCPNCGAALAGGAAMCIQCGYNFATGRVVAAASRATPENAEDDAGAAPAGLLTPGRIKVAGIVLIVAVVGWFLLSSILSTARMKSILATAGEGSPHELITDADLLRDAQRMLPRIVNLCRESFKDPTKEGTSRVNALCRIVKSLPETADLSPVWKAAPEHQNVRGALVEHIAGKRSLDWMCQQADGDDKAKRQVVTEAMKLRLPLTSVPDNDVKALPGAEGGPAAIRQAVAKACADKLAGSFTADVNLVHRRESLRRRGGKYEQDASETLERIQLREPMLTIRVDGENWSVEWFSQRWQGTLEQVRQARLQCTLDQTVDELRRHRAIEQAKDKVLVLTFTPDGPVIDTTEVVTHVPDKLWSKTHPRGETPPADPQADPYKVDQIEELDPSQTKHLITVWYHQLGKPGVSRLAMQLRPATP